VAGVTAANGDVSLCSTAGSIQVNNAITTNATTNRVGLDASAAAQTVTQGAAGIITASFLGARANAGITLDQANQVAGTTTPNAAGNFAAQVTGAGSLLFRNGPSIIVGQTAAFGCMPAVAGITLPNGNGQLVSSGSITDVAGTNISVAGNARFTGTVITLGDNT